MNRRIAILAALMISAQELIQSQYRWDEIRSSSGETVKSVTISPDGHIFAILPRFGFPSRLFRSTDKGVTWTKITINESNVTVVDLALGMNGDIVAATANDGIFLSRDGGNSWTLLGTPISAPIRTVAVDVNGNILAGGANVYRYVQSRNMWIVLKTPSLTSINGLSMNSEGVLFAGTRNAGMLRSTDGGDHWSSVNTGLTSTNILCIAPGSGNNLFVGTEDGVFRSTDGGNRWKLLDMGHHAAVHSLVFDANKRLFAATYRGVYYSTNNGSVWEPLNNGFIDLRMVSIAVGPDGSVVVGNFGGMIYRCDQSGLSQFQQATSAAIGREEETRKMETGEPPKSNSFVVPASRDVTQSGNLSDNVTMQESISETIRAESGHSNPDSTRLLGIVCTGMNTIIAGGENGVIRYSSDGGSSWIRTQTGTSQTVRRILFLNASRGVAVGDSGIVLTTSNGGLSWQPQVTGFGGDIYSVSWADEQHILAAGRRGSVLRSTDAGKTWESLNSGAFFSLRSVVNCGTTTAVVVGVEGTILRSSDGGETWRHSFSGTMNDLNDAAFVNADLGVAVGNGGTIVRTTDGGLSWAPIQNTFNADLASVKFADANVAVAVSTNGSIVRSTDGGLNWANVRDSSSVALSGISFANSTSGFIAGDNGLILRSSDGGAHWSTQVLKAARIERQPGREKVETVVRRRDPLSEKDQQMFDRNAPPSRSEPREIPLSDLQMRLGKNPIVKWKPFDVPTMIVQVPAGLAGGFALGFAGALLGAAIGGKTYVAPILLGGAGAFFGVPAGVCLGGRWMGGNGTYGSTLAYGYALMLGGVLLTAIVPPLGVIVMVFSPVIGYHISSSPVYEPDFSMLPTTKGPRRVEIPLAGPTADITMNVVSLTF